MKLWNALILFIFAAQQLSAAANSCSDLHEAIGYHHLEAQQICEKYKTRKNKIEEENVASCIKDLETLTEIQNWNRSLGALCLHATKEVVQSLTKNTSCIDRYDQFLSRGYWTFEDTAVLTGQTNLSDSLFSYLIKECSKASGKTPAVSSLVYSRTVFHTLTMAGKNDFPLGGLSGVFMDTNQEVYAISDNRQTPNMAHFSLMHLPKSRTKKMEVALRDMWHLEGRYTDLEDLVLDTDGNLIVSSEELAGRTYETDNKSQGPKSYIFKIDPEGQFLEDIPLPDDFYSRTLELDALCGKKEEPGFFASLKELFTGAKRKKLESLSRADRQTCENYAQADGLRYNRGIESLALDKDSKILYFMPEEPLLKKNKIETTVPLVLLDMKSKTHSLRRYKLNEENQSGIVSLLKPKAPVLLVLERGFNPLKKEADVRLYKVKLNNEEGSLLEKKLLLDFKDILTTMPKGLDKVDNFEGMTLGPVSANGNPTLIFVSDNNLSLRQKTDFMILEVPKIWLE